MRISKHFLGLSFIILLCTTAQAQQKEAAAGAQFKASKWKQFWWGKHWRKEWIKPVSFNYFDIDTTMGGFTPLKRGGGHQTKSLQMLSKDGKEYVIRTIDKDLELLIPEEFKGSFVNDIVNDQISTAHPYGPLAISSLVNSVGAMHTNPVILYVTDNPNLGEYRKDFANKLVLFEERPSGDGWEKTALSKNGDDIVNSEKLYEKLLKDNDKYVDQHEYLKIRLMDMLVNDWDRHPDQWVWVGYKEAGKTRYVPFGRDRDQAFSKTDGVNVFLISLPWVLRSLRNMNSNIHDVIGVNLAALVLDKQFMNELKKEEWETIIRNLQTTLTDSVIHTAVMQMPKEINDISGAFVEKRLKQRRDNMMFYGMKYYRTINKVVIIRASDDKEKFTINRINGNTTELTIQQAKKKSQDTIFHRVFTHDVTKEINLYGMGDEDEFIYTGQAKNSIFTRMIGGEGADRYTDHSSDKGGGKRSRIYDTKDNEAKLSSNKFKVYAGSDTTYTNYHIKGFKYDWWKPILTPGYNPDDGVSINLGVMYRKMGWHKTPYAWQQTIGGGYATSSGAVSFFYNGIFKQAIGKWDIKLAVALQAPRYVLNFYGYGNETELMGKKKEFFRVRSSGISVKPAVSRTWDHSSFDAGPVFQSVKVQSTQGKFITLAGNGLDSSVFNTKYFAGAGIAYAINSVTKKNKNPDKGFGLELGSSFLVNLEETKRAFVNFRGNVKLYLPITKSLVFAHRTGAATNIGDYEFYHANTVGGLTDLRGYWRTRFTGQTSFYQNTELRLKLRMLKGYVFRGQLGIYGFFDDGRVWVKHDNSNKFHIDYGGGIYFIPYNKLALNIAYAMSEEVNVFAIRAGFLF